jgi:hypothetical protein
VRVGSNRHAPSARRQEGLSRFASRSRESRRFPVRTHPHGEHQIISVRRLGQEYLESCLSSTLLVFGAAIPAQCDDVGFVTGVSVTLLSAELPQELEAGFAGQSDIHDYDVKLFFGIVRKSVAGDVAYTARASAN